MKDFQNQPPMIVHKARGSYLYTNQGKVIDAISSWWCKSLGHQHPKVTQAIKKQLQRFEHIIGATTTHRSIVELGEMLSHISGKQHLFFASDGSSAVEIAMKLALHAQQIRGTPERCEFISFDQAYHGETLATLAVSGNSLYNRPYQALALKKHTITSIPYVNHKTDPLWSDCDMAWQRTLPFLQKIQSRTAAIIVEPIVQGAAGMHIYSANFLTRLAAFAREHHIYLIADEIMTGLCRTGSWLASHHAKITPDLICLSKGLTSGTIPFSCVLIDKIIYDLFYHEPKINNFLHSHTYSGNALGCVAALATLKVMEAMNMPEHVKKTEEILLQAFKEIADTTGLLTNVRGIGAIVAGDVKDDADGKIAQRICDAALKEGALLRPLGNTIYWLPPLTINECTIRKLAKITLHSIDKTCRNL